MIVLNGIGSIRFHLQTEEWPQYAKEHNLKDPF